MTSKASCWSAVDPHVKTLDRVGVFFFFFYLCTDSILLPLAVPFPSNNRETKVTSLSNFEAQKSQNFVSVATVFINPLFSYVFLVKSCVQVTCMCLFWGWGEHCPLSVRNCAIL